MSMSVPATPMSEEKKRSKKSKLSSPATSLLEKSATWLSSLSGSKVSGNNNNNKVSKLFNFLSFSDLTLMVGSLPYPQILDYSGSDWQWQTL